MPIKKLIHHISKIKKNWKSQSAGINIHHEVHRFTKEVRKNFFTLIITAFGLVAALSWQDALREWINVSFPDRSTLIQKTYVAIIISIITVLVTYFLSRSKGQD